jgi:hypothetical protein
MNSTPSRAGRSLFILIVLAAGISVSRANAQEFHGKFTLSHETRWGAATLPAGDYSLDLDHHDLQGRVLVHGEKQNVIVLSEMIEHRHVPEGSALFTVRNNNRLEVRALYIQQVGLWLEYRAPQHDRLIMAKAPQLNQRVPIAASGN